MANSVMTNVYNQFSTTYMQKKAVGRYDTHKRSELRTLCSSMAKVNRDAPLYLIDSSAEAKQYVISLKEEYMTNSSSKHLKKKRTTTK